MATAIGGNSRGRLTSLVERIERLEEDKKAITADLGEVYSEAKGEGFDVKVLRKVIRRRATDKAKLAEEEALIDLYEAAVSGRLPEDSQAHGRGAMDAATETPLEMAISKALCAAEPA